MNHSPKNYSILYAFIVLILVALQAYYIFNSYQLQEKELNNEAYRIASSILGKMNDYEEENEEELIRKFK